MNGVTDDTTVDDIDDVTQQGDEGDSGSHQQQNPGKGAADDGGGKGSHLEKAMAELAGQVKTLATASQPKPQPKQMTKEEEDEYFGVWNPTKTNPHFIREFFGLPEDADPKLVEAAGQRLAHMQEGLVRQAVVSAQRVLAPIFKKLQDKIDLHEGHFTKQQQERYRTEFYGTYPGLNERRFDKVIAAVASELSEQDFKSEKEYYKALAEGAAASIKELIPDFDLAAEVQTKTKPAGTTPRLPRSGAGGGGGAGNKGSQKQTDPNGDQSDSIWDD